MWMPAASVDAFACASLGRVPRGSMAVAALAEAVVLLDEEEGAMGCVDEEGAGGVGDGAVERENEVGV